MHFQPTKLKTTDPGSEPITSTDSRLQNEDADGGSEQN